MLHRPLVLAVTIALALMTATACGRSGATNEAGDADRPAAATGRAGIAVVEKVVDGDTVRVRLPGRRDSESVRLIGIDTPETHGPGGLRECFGQEASARTTALLPVGTEVRLVRDAEARDRYGRLLAYVYRTSDDLFVNLALAREGFAASLTIPPNVAHRDQFVEAAAEARTRDRGLWGRCGDADKPL
ncbi:MAG: thermonuclease family protein [Actinomycetota bacterium]|nr:thermonuclease family protein [Actinomycetota bacterium]